MTDSFQAERNHASRRPERGAASMAPLSSTSLRLLSAAAAALMACATLGCVDGEGGLEPNVTQFTFDPVTGADVLTPAEVDAIVQAAAESLDAPNMAIAVVDRVGNILRVWNRNPASDVNDLDNRIATSVARTAAFLSHSQAPLTTRTGQFISTFHFPVVFDLAGYAAPFDPTATSPTRPTLGIANTPQGPLWQIDASNRGVVYGPFDPGQELPQLQNPNGTTPSPGFTALPGGVPLYKRTAASIGSATPVAAVERRLVGAIGVYITSAPAGAGTPDPEAAEYAAFSGSLTTRIGAPLPTPAEDYTFGVIPPEGAVYLVGILLPYLGQVERPAGYVGGTYNAISTVVPGVPAQPDPFGYLVSPRDSTDPGGGAGGLTEAEVRALIDATVAEALGTHAAIRLPAQSPTSMVIAVTDGAGEILGLFRMNDATLFSVDIAITKARNSFYYSHPSSIDASGPRAGLHPLDGIVPPGTAITCRTLGFLTQPFYPPGIDGTPPGPLFELALENRKPVRFDQMGFATPAPNQSGLIVFPGSAPLYKNGVLVGGIGVSGDGVEQDDYVTQRGIDRAAAALGLELQPPAWMRADAYEFRGARLPYVKFPQHPGG